MGHTRPDTKRPRSRSDVRKRFGHPWPWMAEDILREQVFEEGRDEERLADLWLCNPRTIRRKAREYGIDLEAEP